MNSNTVSAPIAFAVFRKIKPQSMIRKSGYRFSEKIMLKQQTTGEKLRKTAGLFLYPMQPPGDVSQKGVHSCRRGVQPAAGAARLQHFI
jgi:hypothetical protein